MSPKIPSLRIVIAVTSDSAFLEVNGLPSIVRAIEGLRAFWPALPLAIAVPPESASRVYALMEEMRISHELILCNPNSPTEFATALLVEVTQYEAIVIHDASRPLTHPELLIRLTAAFHDGVDAVRPSIAFTETLKIVRPDGVIRETLDRTSVRQVSSPEIIRATALDKNGKIEGWFVPLKRGSTVEHIEGAPEGLRISSENHRDLLESFLHWRQLNV